MEIAPQAHAEFVQRVLPDGTRAIYVRAGAVQIADDAGRGACLVKAGQLAVVPPDGAPSDPLTYEWASARPYFDQSAEDDPPFVALALSPKCLCCGSRNPPGAATCAQCGSPAS